MSNIDNGYLLYKKKYEMYSPALREILHSSFSLLTYVRHLSSCRYSFRLSL